MNLIRTLVQAGTATALGVAAAGSSGAFDLPTPGGEGPNGLGKIPAGEPIPEGSGLIMDISDGSKVLCVVGELPNGFSGGLWYPPPGSESPSLYASCDTKYSLVDEGDGRAFVVKVTTADGKPVACDGPSFVPGNPSTCRKEGGR